MLTAFLQLLEPLGGSSYTQAHCQGRAASRSGQGAARPQTSAKQLPPTTGLPDRLSRLLLHAHFDVVSSAAKVLPGTQVHVPPMTGAASGCERGTDRQPCADAAAAAAAEAGVRV